MSVSEDLNFSSNNVLGTFANIFPYFMAFIIIAGLSFAFIIGRPDFAVRGLAVAIPGLIASMILIKNKTKKISLAVLNSPFEISQKVYVLLFSILYLTSLTILLISIGRPWYYLIIATILNLIILCQIFSKEYNKNIVLIEMFLSILITIYSVTLKYPLYFGGTDILQHLIMAEVTYLSGHTIPNSLSSGYSHFPLFHILISQATYITNLDMPKAYFVITALIFSISIFFMYYILIRLTKNQKLSLLSVFVFYNLSVVNYYGMYMITRTVAFIGFLILLYLIYKKDTGHDLTYKLLTLLLAVFIVLVHQVSTPQILAVMTLLLASEKIIVKLTDLRVKYIGYNYMLLFSVMFLAYWFHIAFVFTQSVIKTRTDSLTTDAVVIKDSIKAGNEWIFLSQNIDTFIITFFVLIGIIAILWRYRNKYCAVFALVSLLSLPLFIPNPLQTLWQTMTLFRFDRFMLLISPFIAFSFASGIIYQYNLLISKNITKIRAFALITILMFAYIYPSLLDNNPEASDIDSRRYFKTGELVGMSFVFDCVPSNSKLFSDYFIERYLPYTKFDGIEFINFPYYRTSSLNDLNEINLWDGYLILRNEPLVNYDLNFGTVERRVILTKKDIISYDRFFITIRGENKIYSNSDLDVFYGRT